MKNIEETFEECGAILKGHFVLNGWEHTDTYLAKKRIYMYPKTIADLCWEISQQAHSVFNGLYKVGINAVVSPSYGGIVLAHLVASFLEDICYGSVISLFTEKDQGGNQVLVGDYREVVLGKKVLIVDDIFTSGKTVRQLIEEIGACGGCVFGVAGIWNRGNVQSKDIYGVPIISLHKQKIENWQEDQCPLWLKKTPINTNVGRRKEFLSLHPDYPSN